MRLIRNRDFWDKEFLAFCQQEFDIARNYLKNCGKPIDWYDRFMIDYHKGTIKFMKIFLFD